MAMNNELRYLQKQEQRISTSLIQGLNMLSLPTQAIYNYLVELSMGNPMLEIPEPPTPDRYESILGYEQSLTYLDRGRDPVYGAGVGSGADGAKSMTHIIPRAPPLRRMRWRGS